MEVIVRNIEEWDVEFVYKKKNIPYEEAEKWIASSMQCAGKKVWAICTNDEFQNMVGWCSVAKIDDTNKRVSLDEISIVDTKYADGKAYFDTFAYVLKYVFNELKYNRISITCLDNDKETNTFLESAFCNKEGVLKEALFQDGSFQNIAVYAVLRDEYEQHMSDGTFSYEKFLNGFQSLSQAERVSVPNFDDFVAHFAQEINYKSASSITPDLKFRDWNEWSSLLAIELMSVLEDTYGVELDIHDLNSCETFEDIWILTKRKTEDAKELQSFELRILS